MIFKISGCILIFLEKNSPFLGNPFTTLQTYSRYFEQIWSRRVLPSSHFNHRIKIRIIWHIWKTSNFIHIRFSFFNIKKQQLEKKLKNSCEIRFLKTLRRSYKDVTLLLMIKYFQLITVLGFEKRQSHIFIHNNGYLGATFFLPFV